MSHMPNIANKVQSKKNLFINMGWLRTSNPFNTTYVEVHTLIIWKPLGGIVGIVVIECCLYFE